MRAVDLIAKKRDGEEWSDAEIRFMINGYVSGEIPDYQMAAWAMAVYFRGMSARETTNLTLAMAESGDLCDLSAITGIKVDKHSTGGVADTTTLIVAPLAAAAGVPVAKMSGRGLGHTGGTIDKLESFRGFRTDLTNAELVEQVNRIGLAITGQSANLTPADKMLYALRDVTATVHSIPLIASSIMSKKIAAGADVIVLDVKVGEGAFMNSLDDALRLARAMVDIGTLAGRHTVALISDMNRPLGPAIGNALEVRAALRVLKNQAGGALRDISLTIAAQMAYLGGKYPTFTLALAGVTEKLEQGEALTCLRRLVVAQGGDERPIDNPDLLPRASHEILVYTQTSGFVRQIATLSLGNIAMQMGAGRVDKQSIIDLAVGIELRVDVGTFVEVGNVLCVLHTNEHRAEVRDQWLTAVHAAFEVVNHPVDSPQLLHGWVTKDGYTSIETT